MLKGLVFMILRQAANAERRQELVFAPYVIVEFEKLVADDERQKGQIAAVLAERMDSLAREVLAVGHKPFNVLPADREPFEPALFEPFDSEQRNEAHE